MQPISKVRVRCWEQPSIAIIVATAVAIATAIATATAIAINVAATWNGVYVLSVDIPRVRM